MTKNFTLALALLVAGCAGKPVASGTPQPVDPGSVSTAANEYNYSVTADGRSRVFARSGVDFADARIFISERVRGGWSAPRQLDLGGGSHRDSDPWLTPDGRTLYFISDRPAPGREPARRDFDVWRVERRGSGWGAPERLDETVNGRGEELGPELHGDTLYFNSARRSGAGGIDVYSARLTEDGFAQATPLPAPINGAQHDSDFTLSADSRTALFWSTRGGKADLYIARRTADGWSAPQRLPDSINAGEFQFTPSLSRDGRKLIYAGTQRRDGQPDGMADIYEVDVSAALPR